ncbi:MAG: ribosome silencing factor [Bacteroidia bacterium]|nr:ribosome silencing factor [Bacteroidia bacterium]
MAKKRVETISLTDAVIAGMQEKKAKNITLLDLRDLKSAVADYFIVCHAPTGRQVQAIADSVDEYTRNLVNEKPWHMEGMEHAEWVLIDYINVVVHIFTEEKRNFFGIEELWGDAKITEIPD